MGPLNISMYSNTFIAISVRPNRCTEFEYQSFGFLFGRIKIYRTESFRQICGFPPQTYFSQNRKMKLKDCHIIKWNKKWKTEHSGGRTIILFRSVRILKLWCIFNIFCIHPLWSYTALHGPLHLAWSHQIQQYQFR